MDMNQNMENMNMNMLPSEMVFEILKRMDSFDIVNFAKTFDIPKAVINQPVFMETHTVLECALMIDTFCEDIQLLKKLVEIGGDGLIKSECGTTPFTALLCSYQLKFITEEKFHEVYNILFPGDLSFTRSGKCYSGIYHTIMFKNK